jgi:hypothetical protein
VAAVGAAVTTASRMSIRRSPMATRIRSI